MKNICLEKNIYIKFSYCKSNKTAERLSASYIHLQKEVRSNYHLCTNRFTVNKNKD